MAWREAASRAISGAFRRSLAARAGAGAAGVGKRGVDHKPGLWGAAGAAATLAGLLAMNQGNKIPAEPAFCEEGAPRFMIQDSYRRRVFFKYERRIRAFSPPEKVFEYFASIREAGQSFMTPTDLMRAAVPVFPPTDSSMVREGNLAGERPAGEFSCPPSKFFMLFDTNGDGRISFSEYIFFITLISLPEENFSTTFKMFDIDGNGMIDKQEFKNIMGIMRSRTRQGVAQRDGRRSIASKVVDPVEDGGLVQLFFGQNGSKLLSYDDFVTFLRDLHEEILRLEYSHYDAEQKGFISARDFALSLVASADLSKINQYLDLSDALGDDPKFKKTRISYEEFRRFAELRKKLPTLSLAMSSFGKTAGLLTKSDFQRAAAQACGVPLTDAVVDVVFYIFDLNRDGNLSTEEFLGVLQRREADIANPADTGIAHFFKCWWSCARSCRDDKQ